MITFQILHLLNSTKNFGLCYHTVNVIIFGLAQSYNKIRLKVDKVVELLGGRKQTSRDGRHSAGRCCTFLAGKNGEFFETSDRTPYLRYGGPTLIYPS